jgi:hypothetical protein
LSREHSQDDDDDIVEVTRKDMDRWNAAASVIEKSTFLVRAVSWMVSSIAAGAAFLLLVKQLWGSSK